jgi:hypothetical protein
MLILIHTRNILNTPESTDATTNTMVSGITKSAPFSMPSVWAISVIKGKLNNLSG